MKHIAKALSVFHDEVKAIYEDANNPFFKSKYAPLDTILPIIKPALKTAGLIFTQIPCGENELETKIIHIESGEEISGKYKMSPNPEFRKTEEGLKPIVTPQAQASVITYMRRYALVAMLGLNTEEDDDGNKASGKAKGSPAKAASKELDPNEDLPF